tara:strand:- start:13610 stop:14764 length:1155 start_codon:yes stop_codon:yes gene_type:complete
MRIDFSKPFITNESEKFLLESLNSLNHSGNNYWNKKCIDYLKEKYHFGEVFLVPSCTAALEMGVMLAGVEPGDEVILPSYTFSSTATAILMSGGNPIFAEIEPNTMNLDINKLEQLITDKTKCIIPIDYAGISCNISEIQKISCKYNIPIMVDCAQSLNSKTETGEWTGTTTDLASFSFHQTKNYSCGEGGALIVNNAEWVERAYILQEKGTDRKLVIEGLKNKYGWVDKGSSYLLSDILASLLFSQLKNIDLITTYREKVTEAYRKLLKPYEDAGFIKCPKPPKGCKINHHAFFIIFDTSINKSKFLERLKNIYNVSAYIGYQPLHSSIKGKQLGYKPDDLPITEDLASRIARLPFYTELGVKKEYLTYACNSIKKVLDSIYI